QPAASWAVEQALACLAAAGLDAEGAARTAAALWTYTLGAVLAEQSAAAAWPGEELVLARRARWSSDMQSVLGAVAPRVAAMLPRWLALSHDAVFATGLDLLVAGIAPARRRTRAR